MTQIVVERTIDAPAELVFETVADIRRFSEVLPHIVGYEFLTDQHSGVGTRFRETRLMNGKEMTTELEVTEYDPPRRARMVADSHGTIWDTVYEVNTVDSKTVLKLTMDARAYKLMSKLMNRLFKGLIRKGVAGDMDMVKAWCEERASSGADGDLSSE